LTSRAAAESIVGNATTMRARVYEWIYFNGPCTDEQIATGLAMNPSSERPRRLELVAEGLIVASHELGKTTSGRSAVRWECNSPNP
jgi:hypothetical protein